MNQIWKEAIIKFVLLFPLAFLFGEIGVGVLLAWVLWGVSQANQGN